MADTATADVKTEVAADATADAESASGSKDSDLSVDDLAAQDIELDDDSTDDSATDDDGQADEDEDSAEDGKDSDDDAAEDATDDTDKTDEKTDPASERKQELNTEIRDLVARRNTLRKEVADENAKVYGARTASELQEEINPDTGENYTPVEAQLKEMQEKQELRDYNDQVAEAQLVVDTEASRVIADFPMFDEKSSDFNKEIAQGADELMAENLIRDPNTEKLDEDGKRIPGTGQIIGTHLSVYKLYKIIADAAKIATTKGELKGQQNVKKMIASADTVSSAGPKSPSDKGIDAFDKEMDRYL